MPTTSRTKLKFPARGQEPWFDLFEAMLNQLDGILNAHREDRNVLLLGGGTLGWDATSNTLSWNAPIVLNSPHKGFRESVPAGSIQIAESQALYVNITRSPGSNITLTPLQAGVIPNTDDGLLLCYRYGTALWWRNGLRMEDTYSGPLYPSAGSGGGSISGFSRQTVTVATTADTWIGGGGGADSAALQASLSGQIEGPGATAPLYAPDGVDVYLNNALVRWASVPSGIDQWTWVTTGSPAPVIQFGGGLTAGDVVEFRFPY
jgi:hypothetical protein